MPLESARTLTPEYFEGATHAEQLNAMFQFASDHPLDGRILDWAGHWRIDDVVTIPKPPPPLPAPRNIHRCGYLEVIADGLDGVLAIDAPRCTFEGKIYVKGTGGGTLASRTTGDLVRLRDVLGASFDGFDLHGSQRWGVLSDAGSQIHTELGHVTGWDLGSAGGLAPTHSLVLAFDFVAREDIGSINDPNQVSRLELEGDIPEWLREGDLLLFNDLPHRIMALDESVPGAHVVAIYPRLIEPDTSGQLVSCHGGAVGSDSGNTSGMSGSIQTLHCGVTLRTGVYGGAWRNIIAESGGVAIQLGGLPGGDHLGGSVGHLHLEGLASHVVKVCRNDVDPFTISSTVGLDLGKCHGMTPSGPAGPSNHRWRQLRGVVFSNYKGGALENVSPILAHGTLPGSIVVTPRPGGVWVTVQGSSPTIALEYDPEAEELYGTVEAWIYIAGDPDTLPELVRFTSSTAHGTIGDPVLNIHDLPITLNGPTLMHVRRDRSDPTWRIDRQQFDRVV